jgi:hypothetical protein
MAHLAAGRDERAHKKSSLMPIPRPEPAILGGTPLALGQLRCANR